MNKLFKILFCFLMIGEIVSAQNFDYLPPDIMSFNRPLQFKEVFATSSGTILLGSSVGLWNWDVGNLDLIGPVDGEKKTIYGPIPNISEDYFKRRSGVKCIAEGPGKIIYFVSDNNNLGWIDHNQPIKINYPPFNFPGWNKIDITKIWIDEIGDLYIAARTDTIYVIKEATKLYDEKKNLNYKIDPNGIITSGAKKIEKIVIGPNIIPYSFAGDYQDGGSIYIGTSHGIFMLNKFTGKIENLFEKAGKGPATITSIETIKYNSEIWFSTLENGMGFSNDDFSTIDYFPYKKGNKLNSVQTFTRISDHYFLAAVTDSVPALFNTLNGEYFFIQDTSFKNTKNKTTSISINAERIIYIVKDGGLFVGGDTLFSNVALTEKSKNLIRPSLMEIEIQGKPYAEIKNYHDKLDSLKRVTLKFYENKLSIYFAMRGATQKDTMVYEWKMEGYQNNWKRIEVTMLSNKFGSVDLEGLKPGKYVFRVRAKVGNKDWLKNQIELTIIIEPPFWQTWWFWTIIISGVGLIVGSILWWRIRAVKKREREKFAHEKQILELEAKALRSQMNPHFVFNSLNSIKSLIQQDEKEKSVTYLTTFSKLIRTLFNNADKKEISLYDEIETCKLYLQLEAMRFDTKFSYAINVDDNIDLKSIQIPALIIQPFIENAIWHGIVPRNSGGHVSLNVLRRNGTIEIVIDDDGIGREASQQNKSTSGFAHQSKGVNLTLSRLELDNLLQQRQAELKIIDKEDGNGAATGTTVILSIKEEL